MCKPPLPAHAFHPTVGPNLSKTPRAKYTWQSKLSFGSDGVQTTCANQALDHFLFSGFQSFCASCLPAAVSQDVLVCGQHLAHPESFLPSLGKLLVRALHGTELCLSARRSRLRTRVLAVFLSDVNPSSKTVYRVRLEQKCRTPHCTSGELGVSVVWYRFSIDATQVRSKPCTNRCAFSTSPLDLES